MLYLLSAICLAVSGDPLTVIALHPSRPCMAPVAIRAVGSDTAQSTADTTLLPLTDELLKNYEGVRTDMQAFWGAHKALKDSATAGVVTVNVNFTGKGLPAHPDTVREFNYVVLAAHEPAIAAVFTAHHLPASQYIPVTVTAWRALYIAQLSQAQKVAVAEDPASLMGKDVALVTARLADLQAVAVGWHFPAAGAGAGGGDDLSP
jgi:hypothetical protein